MDPFVAKITPIDSGGSTPEPPLGIWGPNDPRPTPPIFILIPGYPPLTIWGGANQPFPTPPIHIPGLPPLQIWGPNDPRPGYGLPGIPPGIWGGGNEPFPTPPIHIPPVPPDFVPPENGCNCDPKPTHPIFYPVVPEHPIALPPGQSWPPLPIEKGISGKVLMLVHIFGIGIRWILMDNPVTYPPKSE